jgi:hypothetical protein
LLFPLWDGRPAEGISWSVSSFTLDELLVMHVLYPLILLNNDLMNTSVRPWEHSFFLHEKRTQNQNGLKGVSENNNALRIIKILKRGRRVR